MATQPQANRQTAIMLHLSLLMGPLLLIAVAAWIRLRPGAGPSPVTGDSTVLRYACYAVAASAYALAVLFRLRIPVRDSAEDETAWWGRHQARALVVWALIEGGMIFAGVVFLLTGDLPTLVSVGGTGLVLMLVTAPGRLGGG